LLESLERGIRRRVAGLKGRKILSAVWRGKERKSLNVFSDRKKGKRGVLLRIPGKRGHAG